MKSCVVYYRIFSFAENNLVLWVTWPLRKPRISIGNHSSDEFDMSILKMGKWTINYKVEYQMFRNCAITGMFPDKLTDNQPRIIRHLNKPRKTVRLHVWILTHVWVRHPYIHFVLEFGICWYNRVFHLYTYRYWNVLHFYT